MLYMWKQVYQHTSPIRILRQYASQRTIPKLLAISSPLYLNKRYHLQNPNLKSSSSSILKTVNFTQIRRYTQNHDIKESIKETQPLKDLNTDPVKDRKSIGAKLRYFLLRQNRPFNIDEITAFFSWILMGNVLWILIGTTTFFGFLIYVVNWIGDGEVERMVLRKLLTFDNKLNVDLNSKNFKATWEDGKIKIRGLKVFSNLDSTRSNYKFDIDELNLTFSFNKWLDGLGLIDGIDIDGLHGDVNIVDNDQLMLDDSFNDKYTLNHLKVKHSNIKFHNETYFKKPLELVIFNCELDQLRRKWMVYDFLNANSMFGSLGGSLFTLHKRQHRFAHFNENGESNHSSLGYEDDEMWKRITRLRIDMLNLSFLNNENSKLNWIKSGKAELIFDIMLPNEDDSDICDKDYNESKFSFENIKNSFVTIYKKLIDDYEKPATLIEQNKYVVIDMKINYYNLKAKTPPTLPCSSLTGVPYISSQDLQALITFINDEKFGLSSNNFQQISNGLDKEENSLDGSEIEQNDDNMEDYDFNDLSSNDEDEESNDIVKGKMLPPIKFRIIQNLNDFEYLDLPSLLSFTSLPRPETGSDEKVIKSFENTNKFIDASIIEVLALLLVYKQEIQTKLIGMYSRRSGFEILFNNFILGNLILVGLGSFVI